MKYVVSPPEIISIPVKNDDAAFPVRRVWCVGRNYADHAREMGHDPNREPPFFFAKPAEAVTTKQELVFPAETQDLHYEVELVAAIGVGGRNIAASDALNHVYGYAVGLDMTRRDLQATLKKAGRPWELAKSFDESCPISEIVKVADIGHPQSGRISLQQNGEYKQDSNIDQMIWPLADAIAYLSRFVEILSGDLIMTGTPAGVGALQVGDTLLGTCEHVGQVRLRYIAV